MPPDIHSLHTIVTLIAIGILVGLGWALAHLAVTWPASRVAYGAAVICVLIIVIAWLV